MRILGIDTSSASLSIAVTDETRLQSEYSIHHKLTHSEQLMPAVDRMLRSLDCRPKDLDAIGVCVGPGSFTGVRIGIAAVNAMAMALSIPAVGISSLEAMAYGAARFSGTVFATLDAQRERVYRLACRFEEGWKIVHAEDVISLDQLQRELAHQKSSILLGDALSMMEGFPKTVILGERHERYIRASSVCLLTERKLSSGTAECPRPVYLRKSQAEIQFEEKLRKQSYQALPMSRENVEGAYQVEMLSFVQPWTRTSFYEELKNPNAYYMVIREEESGKIVAFGGFWKILEQAHVCNIAVHPDYRGLGVGRRIVEALLEKAKELQITEMTLEVRASNEAAKNLYEKYGFKLGGIRKEYYTDNREDALILWRGENSEVL